MSVSTKQRVLDLLNEANNSRLTFTQVAFSDPQPYDGPFERNTTIVVSPTGSTALTGSVGMYYDRLDLSVQFGAVNLVFDFVGGYATTHDLLPALNARFGLGMEPNDFIDEPLAISNVYPYSHTLRASPTSYGYVGEFTVSLTEPLPINVVTAGELANVVLGWEISEAVLDDTDFIISNNLEASRSDQVLVGARARLNSATDAPSALTLPADDTPDWAGEDYYPLELTSASDNWMVDLGARMSGYDAGELLEGLYEVSLRIAHTNPAAGELKYVLETADGMYRFRHIASGDVLAVTYSNYPDTIATSVDMKDLATKTNWAMAFSDVPVNGSGVPYCDAAFPGYFVFELTATAKIGVDGQEYIGSDVRAQFLVEVVQSITNPWLSPVSSPAINTFEEGFTLNGDWVLDSTWSAGGSGTSLRSSPSITDGGESRTYLDVVDGTNQTIQFNYRVSSEQDYDFLQVYVAGTKVYEGSGEHEGLLSFPLAAGAQRVEWVFVKDVSAAEGSDAAWIDNVQLMATPRVGDQGFYVAQDEMQVLTADTSMFEPVEGNDLPDIYNAGYVAIASGKNSKITVLTQLGSVLHVHYSEDGGRTFPLHQMLSNFTMRTTSAVYFQGCCYFEEANSSTLLPARLYRLTPNFLDITEPGAAFTPEYVLDLGTNYGSTMYADDTTMLVANYNDAALHWTNDGLSWDKMDLRHPYAVTANNQPFFNPLSVTMLGSQVVVVGNPRNTASDVDWQGVHFQTGTLGGTLTHQKSMIYSHTDASYGDMSLLAVGSTRLVLVFSDVYDNNNPNYPEGSTCGDIWVSDDICVTWTQKVVNSGISQGRISDDGSVILVTGWPNTYLGGTAVAAHSLDNADTWGITYQSGSIFDDAAQREVTVYNGPRLFEAMTYPSPVAVPTITPELNQNVFGVGADANSRVNSIIPLADGTAIVAGPFLEFNGQARKGIARLNADGTLDSGFNPTFSGTYTYPQVACVQPDGKIILVGKFTAVNGLQRPNIVRLNTDGSVDTGFPTVAFTSSAGLEFECVVLASDGKIYVAGRFGTVNGVARAGIVRLNSDGTVDTSFSCALQADKTITYLHLLSNGQFFAGGTVVDVKLYNSDGALASVTPFVNNDEPTILGVNELADGSLLAYGGNFGVWPDQTAVVRWLPGWSSGTWTKDTTLIPTAGYVYSIYELSASEWLIGYSYPDYQGTGVNYLTRVNRSMTPLGLSGFTDISVDGSVREIVSANNGAFYLRGGFDIASQASYPRSHQKIVNGLIKFVPKAYVPPA